MTNFGYKKIFNLEPFYPKREHLDKLATMMSGKWRFPDLTEKNNHFSNKISALVPRIPAGYTYLAQFIGHDISFDEKSNRHIREDFPWEIIEKSELERLRNLRYPVFNLETVYGHEIPINRGEIPRSELMLQNSSLPLLRLGNTNINDSHEDPNAGKMYPNDLPRKNASVEASIVDPRNDENLLLAQTQVAFIKFHNALVAELSESGKYKGQKLFNKARKLAIRYYQTIILTDFLPKIVKKSVLDEVLEKVNSSELFYQPKPDDMFMPLEFSVAGFRFAHSMIRNKYNVNKINSDTSINELLKFTGKGEMGSAPYPQRSIIVELPSSWIINWNLFYNINDPQLNTAELIDTEISSGLLSLRPLPFHKTGGRASVLAALDLYRGRRFGLPAGQDVARIIGASPLSPNYIENLIWSKKVDEDIAADEIQIKTEVALAFAEKTPLWFYILAESEHQSTSEVIKKQGFTDAGKLGAVGSRIVAETFVQLLFQSDYSILQSGWEKDDGFLLEKDETFNMMKMFEFINSSCKKHYKILYPKKRYPDTVNSFDELNPLEKGY